MQTMLAGIAFRDCLEIGCGTGKNTVWLAGQADEVLAIDFSEGMLAKARGKVDAANVTFVQADITQYWSFTQQQFDLVTFSLVLEHIQDLEHVFQQASERLNVGGYLYLGELHPFKQYTGTKARFDTETGRQEVACYTHHVSDFVQAAQKQGLQLTALQEYFDAGDRTAIPRILSIIFRKVA